MWRSYKVNNSLICSTNRCYPKLGKHLISRRGRRRRIRCQIWVRLDDEIWNISLACMTILCLNSEIRTKDCLKLFLYDPLDLSAATRVNNSILVSLLSGSLARSLEMKERDCGKTAHMLLICSQMLCIHYTYACLCAIHTVINATVLMLTNVFECFSCVTCTPGFPMFLKDCCWLLGFKRSITLY